MFKKRVLPYILFIAIALAAGGLSALLSGGGMEELQNLNQPALAPPGAVFPVVWTVLFVLMGISAGLVWTRSGDGPRNSAIGAWTLQLFFNFGWSILFFGLGLRGAAFFWLLALIVLVIIMVIKFHRISVPAAVLQAPYMLWLLFAAYLNFEVWALN